MSEEDEGWRFVSTLRYLRAHRGEFVFDDHGSNFKVICSNLDLTITKILDYRGHASCSGGTIRISDYEPMWMDLATDFELDGARVHLTRVNLETDGASTVLEGDVDTANLPEMTFELESDIDLTRMREIFFADDNFTASGEGHFTGSFHRFADGYDLRWGDHQPGPRHRLQCGAVPVPEVGRSAGVAARPVRYVGHHVDVPWRPRAGRALDVRAQGPVAGDL